jgi:transcriptional regulator GlxA family with amidase domain
MLTVGFLLPERFQIMALAPASAFEMANVTARERLYDVRVLSEHGGAIKNSLGLSIETRPLARSRLDTLIVGGLPFPQSSPAGLIAGLRRASRRARRTASVCTGAFLLAEAGLLDGKRATTHWIHARDLHSRFPSVRVEEDRIYIIDGAIWTSAGMTAGVDLALGMIEKDFGAQLARAVARTLVVYHRRTGGQTQHSALLELDLKSDRIQQAMAYARSHLTSALTVEELAAAANLSPRQFSRAFKHETGQSPAKAVEQLRVETARVMVESTRHPVDVIAREAGFADPERMRRAFLRAFGQPPQAIRRTARNP